MRTKMLLSYKKIEYFDDQYENWGKVSSQDVYDGKMFGSAKYPITYEEKVTYWDWHLCLDICEIIALEFRTST